MTSRRSHGIPALLLAAGLGLSGCAAAAEGADTGAADAPASVQEGQGGGPGMITLSEAAEQRLGIQTTAVVSGAGGLVVPYSALVYQPDGSAWAFVRTAPHTYQRAALAVSGISGDTVTVTSGPRPGTPVVTQGAAELVGVETGIDGEE